MTTTQQAQEYIRKALADGPRLAGDIKSEMYELGFRDGSISDASKRLGVKFRRSGTNWLWSLESARLQPVQRYDTDTDGLVIPAPDHEAELVAGDLRNDDVYELKPGRIGIISDVHIPYHHVTADKRGAYVTALEALRDIGINQLVINGDYIDFYALSRHERDKSRRDLAWEIQAARSMLRHLRSWFGPDVEIIYREGNHEERWWKYLMADVKSDTASMLSAIARADGYDTSDMGSLKYADLPTVLKLPELNIKWVDGRQRMKAGHLNIDHGHEFYGSGGVMPARAYMLKTMDNILVGHVHKTSEFTYSRPLDNSVIGGWSVGCLCDLRPWWFPRNNWNWGYAYVDLDDTDRFTVTNRIIL